MPPDGTPPFLFTWTAAAMGVDNTVYSMDVWDPDGNGADFEPP